MYKLLIVDDELWSRRLIKEVLDWKSLGFDRIHEAENGLEALEQLKTHHHLMVMDMRMPGMDGVELLERMGQAHKTRIIVMSGYDDFDYIRQALKGRAIDYLLKPIIKDELERAVRQAVSVIRQDDIETNLLTLASDLETNQAFITYLGFKNGLYGAIVSRKESEVMNTIENIERLLDQEKRQKAFRGYVVQDLRYMIDELKESHLPQSRQSMIEPLKDDENPMTHIRENSQKLMDLMGQSETRGKLYIESVIGYIQAHYTKNMTLDSLATIFFISKEHLSRSFKRETGKTVTNYINEKRIAHAQQLMVGRNLPIKTAAAMSGFTHIHYFYKVFKRHTKMTPVAYVQHRKSISCNH